MKLSRGNMWNSPADLYLFTANSTIRKDGCLVMGRGAAYEAQTMWPGCNKVFGGLINRSPGLVNPMGKCYGVVVHPELPLGAFQVKYQFRDDANLSLIAYSSELLRRIALVDLADYQISMNFPGIGWGRQARESVLPIIERLPDNVTVWEYV